MITEERVQEMREYVEKSMSPPNNCPPTMRLSGGLYGDGPTLGEIRDLLSEREELLADNARLLVADGRRNYCGHCGAYWNATMEPMKHRPWCATLQEHPGAALLARHAEELAAKDAAYVEATEKVEAIFSETIAKKDAEIARSDAAAIETIKQMQADLDRTREALRQQVIVHDYTESDAWSECRLCDGCGGPGMEPKHEPVTLPSDTEPGPCPARKGDL